MAHDRKQLSIFTNKSLTNEQLRTQFTIFVNTELYKNDIYMSLSKRICADFSQWHTTASQKVPVATRRGRALRLRVFCRRAILFTVV